MLELPYPLAEIHDKVLETTPDIRSWTFSDPYFGIEVKNKRRLDELTFSFNFTLPKLTSKSGILNLLTIVRGRPGTTSRIPEFWNPLHLQKERGGVYAHVTYDPSRSVIEVRMNVGSDTPELQGVSVEGVDPELVCGRVLELYVEISHCRIFASLNDGFTDGDLVLDAEGASTGDDPNPWGSPASGCWWVTSGMGNIWDRESSPLPPGVGISDLRVTLGSDTDEAAGSLLYSGALDHMVHWERLRRDVRVSPRNGLTREVEKLRGHLDSLQKVLASLEQLRLLAPISSPPRSSTSASEIGF